MTVFRKKDWITGEVITEADMDRLEDGVQDAFTTAAAVDIILTDHILDTDVHITASDREALDAINASESNPIATINDITAAQAGLGNVENILNNYDATTDPLTTSNGYNIGSIWVNTSNDKSYICVDNTTNANVWKDITASGSVGSGSITGIHNDLTGIQGGSAGNYYHMTYAELSSILYHLTDYSNPHQTDLGDSGYVSLDTLGYLERDQIPPCNLRNIFASPFTIHSTPEDNNWRGLCWSPDLRIWVATSSTGTNRVMTSTDGINWTVRSAAEANSWAAVAWSPTLQLFAAVAYDGVGSNRVMTSPDGITWTARSASNNTKHWTAICWSPELAMFAAVAYVTGAEAGAGVNVVMTSTNGTLWTEHNAPCEAWWEDICWSPELNLFVAVASASNTYRVMTSPDGENWTGRNAAAAIAWGGVAWSPTLQLFAAVAYTGTNNRVMTSTNGIDWVTQVPANNNNWYKVVWAPEFQHFVASALSGTGNRVMYSRDGVNWYAAQSAADNSWYTLGYSTTLAQVVCLSTTGTGNRCMTSPSVMDYAIDGDYAKVGQFDELYVDTYPVLTSKETVVSKTGTYTATIYDRVIICNGTFTVNLPLASRATGITYVIKNIGSGTITIDGYSSETIDGATTKALSAQWASARIVSNGTAWFVI